MGGELIIDIGEIGGGIDLGHTWAAALVDTQELGLRKSPGSVSSSCYGVCLRSARRSLRNSSTQTLYAFLCALCFCAQTEHKQV